jgi:metal-dependent amidase/aminoacylase/carboxypeptidase family protein
VRHPSTGQEALSALFIARMFNAAGHDLHTAVWVGTAATLL